MLAEREFLSPNGIRALSRFHKDCPYILHVNGTDHRVDYEPAESSSDSVSPSRRTRNGSQIVRGSRLVAVPSACGKAARNGLGESCTSYAERFRLARRFVHLQNNALSFEQAKEGDDVFVLCAIHPALRPEAHQYVEAIVALSVRNARSLLGPRWDPVRVEFAHGPPPSMTEHSRYFRCPVRFRSHRDGFLVRSADFHRRLPQGSQETAAFLEAHLASQEDRWPTDLRGQVENLIAAQLTGGGVSLARIAALLAVSPRTLQRRLADEQQDFGDILAFVRTQVVRNHLAQKPSMPLARLCHLLGYSEPSAASRFIKAQFGRSARTLLREGLASSPDR